MGHGQSQKSDGLMLSQYLSGNPFKKSQLLQVHSISDNSLICCSGPDLLLYINGQLFAKTQPFQFTRISQIILVSPTRFIAFGSKELCCVDLVLLDSLLMNSDSNSRLTSDSAHFNVRYHLKFHNWIQSVCHLPGDELAVLFSCSTLQRWSSS